MRTVQEARAQYPDFDQRLRQAYAILYEMGQKQLAKEQPKPAKKAA